MGLSAAGHCATDHRLGLQCHVSRCLQFFAHAHTMRSILSKGVTLFQISSDTKKPKRKRDNTVLGRLQSTVRKFVFQDQDGEVGHDARVSGGEAAATVPSACASSFRVTFNLFFQPFQFVPRKIYHDPRYRRTLERPPSRQYSARLFYNLLFSLFAPLLPPAALQLHVAYVNACASSAPAPGAPRAAAIFAADLLQSGAARRGRAAHGVGCSDCGKGQPLLLAKLGITT